MRGSWRIGCSQRSDARDHLNLQIDPLAEKEVTKALQLLQAICRHLEVSDTELDLELNEMVGNTSVDSLAKRISAGPSLGFQLADCGDDWLV